ncbi:uncharacterized protein LOC107802279 isoform X2 [Nicotiana tabacum]|uniref:Uncharacterized N-acetyltransferase p20-like isoform X2 n=1 Tax=Nicotiana tabacum TaxID=4097 RepID=A0A1S4AX38_TOBAC|nr:PREDICTED: uncharacterized N-acetyltransferase p20-like isoform X2 [Nicotiana tabacum]XP_016481254.1 PREDICTED: uncharacterized N-acetyltransferase p20-like isoform X2 [Nicotiana tabacum]
MLLQIYAPFHLPSPNFPSNPKHSNLVVIEMDEEIIDITLRPIEISDADDFMSWATDEKVSRFCTWDTYTCKNQALEFLSTNAIPHPWFKAICISNKAIGSISVTPNSGTRAELGYVLAYKYWGKGIVTNAVKMVTSIIFSEWPNLERLEALVDVDNTGSQRVLEKASFFKEGVLRKYVVLKGRSRDMNERKDFVKRVLAS